MEARTLSLSRDARNGRKLGKYEVVSRLGSGGMAEIFLAYQRGPGGFKKLVVLKQVLPDVKAEEEAVKMFLDEAKITAAFAHPNIAQVYDLDDADGELFLAMEFVPGADLVEIAKACADSQEAIPTGFTLASVRDCALALHYAHTFTDPAGRPRPTIHRDVAEKNIMVTYDGITKLLDFGIAKAQGRATRTAAGMVKGTSGYMSPEQVKGEPLDARSDVFSLGVVLHEMLTGSRLFYGKDAASELVAVLDMEVWPPSERNREVTPEIDRVVFKALAKPRDQRFSTALEMARALERASRPLIWDQEQCGSLVARHFSARRDQTQKLVAEANADESTGYVRPPQEALRQAKSAPKRGSQEDDTAPRKPAAPRGSGPKQDPRPKPGARPAEPKPKVGPPEKDERTVMATPDIEATLPPSSHGYGDEEMDVTADRTVRQTLPPQARAAKAPRRPEPRDENPFQETDATVLGPRAGSSDASRRDAGRARASKKKGRGAMRWVVVGAVLALLALAGALVWGMVLKDHRAQPPPPPRVEF